MLRTVLALLSIAAVGVVYANDLPYVNWENHPAHPLALSPDHSMLAVAHTADNRVQLFDVSEGHAVRAGHVVVGVDPVSVRWRTNTELWVVNHISDSVSIVDVTRAQVKATLPTSDEPFDVVFAGSAGRAFVSASQANQVQVFDPTDLGATPLTIEIDAEEPRALAVSDDGSTVYAAIFESGNRSTIVGGGLQDEIEARIEFPPNLVNDSDTPNGGVNPPPNSDSGFVPALTPGLPPPPAVGLIVKQDAQNRWRDDTNGDWTELITGAQANRSGRVPGWTLVDRDIAVINADTLAVNYAENLMNIGMAIAYNAGRDEVTLVGTDSTNEIRFEPNINGRFLRVNIGRVSSEDLSTKQLADLNPQLNYQTSTTGQAIRDQAIGDPRGIVWQADGQRGYVSGMGSNNVIVIDGDGSRTEGIAPIEVGEGPTGLALDENRQRLYVWNHFAASLSVLDTTSNAEVDRVALHNPLPAAIREGRVFLYGTHETSGLGHVSCASCHVDARIDRLAWDLGDPSGEVKLFNQNCQTSNTDEPCEDYHPMKGPMVTQTLQDIVGKEPFHWRGDRDGIEEFNGAFEGLLGDDRQLTAAQMQRFEDHLATIYFPPNPFRNFDNTLPDAVDLSGHVTSNRFGSAGRPLGTGNPQRGLQLYTSDFLDDAFQCSSCHTLPTGMAVNGPLLAADDRTSAGGTVMDMGEFGENHLGVIGVDGSTNRAIKTPQLRNMYEKVGFEMSLPESRAGFGFLHDGTIDSLARFLSVPAFSVNNDQDVADLVALMLAFSGSDFAQDATPLGAPAPQSNDSHAAVGQQLTLFDGSQPPRLNEMLAQANNRRVDVVVHAGRQAWTYDASSGNFSANDSNQARSIAEMIQASSSQTPQTWTVVPSGLGNRLGIDRDGDGIADQVEIEQGSNPTDPTSTQLRPRTGLWYNPERSGHGLDVELLGANLFATWYTYNDDGTPTWYQAAGPFDGSPWQADLSRFTWNNGAVDGETVGTLKLDFSSATTMAFEWQLGERSGTEPFERFAFDRQRTLRDYTGTWFDNQEPGWGLTIDAQGDTRVAVAYFYDSDNQPRWALGVSDNAPSGSLDFDTFTGFCPDCEHVSPQASSAGTIEWLFSTTQAANATLDVNYAALGNSRWQRGPVTIVPLSEPAFDPAVF